MNIRALLASAALAAAAMISFNVARAVPLVHSYPFTYEMNLDHPVSNIVVIWDIHFPNAPIPDGPTYTICDIANPPCSSSALSSGVSSFMETLDDDLEPPFQFYPVDSLLLGVAQDLPGDPAGTNHLVVFGNFTEDQIGMDFSALFPGVDENSVIDDLRSDSLNLFSPSSSYSAFVSDFQNDGLAIPLNGSFDVVAFSGGTLIGTGTSSLAIGSVPEPSTIALLGAGLLCLLGMMRRRSAG